MSREEAIKYLKSISFLVQNLPEDTNDIIGIYTWEDGLKIKLEAINSILLILEERRKSSYPNVETLIAKYLKEKEEIEKEVQKLNKKSRESN